MALNVAVYKVEGLLRQRNYFSFFRKRCFVFEPECCGRKVEELAAKKKYFKFFEKVVSFFDPKRAVDR